MTFFDSKILIRKSWQVPKKNEGDVASTKSEPGSSALPVPVANPIRKKPQPRKLKNL